MVSPPMRVKSLEGLPEASIWRTENLNESLYNAVIFQLKEKKICLKRWDTGDMQGDMAIP